MAGEWQETTLGELLDAQGGSILTGPFGTVLKAAEYSPIGVPVISVSEVGFGHIRVHANTPRVDPAVTQRLSKYILQPGDIVFARKGAGDAVERSALVSPRESGWFLGSDSIRIRLPECCFPRYVSYWLRTQRHRDWMKQHSVGTTMPALNQGIIARIPIALPPVPEQRAIAHILGSLDDKIDLNRRMNETLEALARAIFKAWFVDFDPVRAKMEGRRPVGMDAETSELFPSRMEESEIGEIPPGWEVSKFGTVATNPRRSIQPSEMKPGTAYIALEHMPRRSIALGDWDDADIVESNKSSFERGEILFGKLRPYFHKVGVAPLAGVCSTDILVVAPKSAEWFGFVLCHASSDEMVQHADGRSTGTKMPRANWTDLAEFSVARPTSRIAAAFSKAVEPLVDRIQTSLFESRTLAQLRDTLLPKLLSGELRVPDAEKMAEAAT